MSNPEPNVYSDLAYESVEPRKKLNWLGITSLGMGLLVGLLELVLIVLAGVRTNAAGGTMSETEAMMIGFGILGGLIMALVGGAVGFGSLFIRGREKISGWIGVTINAVIVLGVLALLVIGLLA